MRKIDGNISSLVHNVSGRLLNRLVTNISGIKAALISTVDGFEIAAECTDASDIAKLSAVSSTLSAIGNMAMLETDMGTQYRSVTIENDNGFLVIMDIQYKTYPMIFCVVASREAMLNHVLHQAKIIIDVIANKLPKLE
ncbi:roadblock/LC7 domain-containing protein [Entomomonas asaccharolytica]|uniref:Roadblock/LC7 domain-containing protein n=1 Tax=Entomomonas asaccharolytica TaxID=2785331 RepID=A0A974RXH7_9GAMM|nr:roadblock/LC7 domain-containing protein [Entomomonas asaccharolytica]QQP84874.1 roadblock/LC7 domain-containing protein [Entomomonas asaccharolytica]